MVLIKVKYDNKEVCEIVGEFSSTKEADKFWEANKEDYVNHPHYVTNFTTEKDPSFFTLQKGKVMKTYKVTKVGMAYNKESRSVFVSECDENGNIITKFVHQLVFSPLLGNVVHVTDDEIWDVMKCTTSAQKAARMKDFLSHKKYFETANTADNPSWHRPTERAGSNEIWTACYD